MLGVGSGAVVLCSITLLTKARAFFYVGLALALVGTGVGIWAFVI